MKVVLRDDVENLGTKGDVVDVADGYARNYLVPRGLAMKATMPAKTSHFFILLSLKCGRCDPALSQ